MLSKFLSVRSVEFQAFSWYEKRRTCKFCKMEYFPPIGNSSEGSSPGVTLSNNASTTPPDVTTAQRPVSLHVTSSPEVRTSLLHQCATSGDATQLRKLLVEDKIPVYTTTPDGTSALHCAAEAGNQGNVCEVKTRRHLLCAVHIHRLRGFSRSFCPEAGWGLMLNYIGASHDAKESGQKGRTNTGRTPPSPHSPPPPPGWEVGGLQWKPFLFEFVFGKV